MTETDAIVFVIDDDPLAVRLGISEITVKLHRHQGVEKMKAESLAELVRMAEKPEIPATKN